MFYDGDGNSTGIFEICIVTLNSCRKWGLYTHALGQETGSWRSTSIISDTTTTQNKLLTELNRPDNPPVEGMDIQHYRAAFWELVQLCL